LSFCHFVKIHGKGIYTTYDKVYHGGSEMEMIGKVICLIAMVSVLSLPAIAGSQSASEIKDHGIQYMDCIYDAGFTRGPTSEDANDDDSGVMLPPPLEYRNDEGSCGLRLPDSTEHEVPSPPPQSPQPPIPPDEEPGVEPPTEEEPEPQKPPVKIPDITTPDLARESDESNDGNDIIKDISDTGLSGPKVGIPIIPGDLTGESGDPIDPNGGGGGDDEEPPGGNQGTQMEGEQIMNQGANTRGATAPGNV